MAGYRHSSLATASRREFGFTRKAGDTAGFQHNLASNIKVHHTWDPRKTIRHTDNGGVFNFDFSKDGSLLGVACERKSVLLFDPFNGQLVTSKYEAHTDCVNCVKFLDDRMFATCSDDTTVALWDVRYLKHSVQVFRGHSNWVKNIEYDAGGGRLVTSGFDGCIYTWDINRYSSENQSERVFYTSGLMRSKLFPDASKLLISTHEGYIIVIHNLDLTTLAEDLKGFKPNMYRLMQRTKTPLRIGLMYNHVFEQKRNRVEFISDWPTGNDANIISSLQVHPQGWCVASRNTDSSENTEWTCIHEIQTDKVENNKRALYPWEVEAPHTSSSFCAPTNTPAYSSVAPSQLNRMYQQLSSEGAQRSSSGRNQRLFSEGAQRSPSGSANRISSEGAQRSTSGSANRISSEGAQRSSSGSARRLSSEGAQRTLSDQVSSSSIHQSREQNQQQSNSTPGTGFSAEAVPTPASQSGGSTEARREPARNFDDVTLPVTSVGPATTQEAVQGSEQGSNSIPAAGGEEGQEEEANSNGRVHNALIQIRRSARNAEGNFSLSISVHTANGRTIEFNQSDLESEDEEDDNVVIEQIISGVDNDNNDTRNAELQRRYFTRLFERNEAAREIESRNTSTEQSSNSRSADQMPVSTNQAVDVVGDTDNDHNDDDADSDAHMDAGNVEEDVDSRHSGSDRDYLSAFEDHEDHEEEFDLSDNADGDDTGAGVMLGGGGVMATRQRTLSEQLFRASVGPHPPDLQQDYLSDLRSAQEDLYSSSTATRTTQSIDGNNRTRIGLHDDYDDLDYDDESDDDSNIWGSVTDPRMPESSSISSSAATTTTTGSEASSATTTTPSQTNTVMFFIRPTSGDRRRRVFNLRYMDSYTERENNMLQSKIHMNQNRLKGYMEECNVGRGFIKELAFSSDGRLISSPFGFGFRIFAFDSDCNELCDCVPASPVKLYEVTCSLAHVNCVVATKFSPTHNLVVSGCLDGKITFHQPVL